ncbi:unnamed protein product, partial [Meganyctiphanes norvegica]
MIKMDYPLFSLLLLLIYYMIWITESKTISFNRSGESIVIKSQDSSSNNYKLNWLLQTCITDVEEIIMGLDPEPVDDDDQLFHLLNCEDMGMFLNTLQGYHRQLTEFPITSLENNNSEMNKWFKRTEGMIRKHLAKLQSDCTPSLDLQDIMDNFLDCLLNKGRSMWEGAQNGNDEDSLLEEQRLKSILIALKLRITTPRQSDEPQELQNPYEHVGEIFLVLDSHMREVPATFLSVALGSRLIQRGWEHFNTSSSLVRTLSSALSPAILRMGGSSANYLYYDPEATKIENNENNYQHISIPKYDDQGSSYEYRYMNYTNYTMLGYDLNNLLEFVDAVNFTLLWDMNHFLREADGGWDPTNARMIIEEVSRKSPNVIWQLGNEPNSYEAHTEFSITGHQDALDYGVFRRELLSVLPEVTLVGPDTTKPRIKGSRISDEFGFKSDPVVFLRDFLTYGNQDVDVISWHQYYMDGRTCTVEDFMDPNLMDVLINQLDAMVVVRDELAPGKPIWLSKDLKLPYNILVHE